VPERKEKAPREAGRVIGLDRNGHYREEAPTEMLPRASGVVHRNEKAPTEEAGLK
jgi:hypothetical protein